MPDKRIIVQLSEGRPLPIKRKFYCKFDLSGNDVPYNKSRKQQAKRIEHLQNIKTPCFTCMELYLSVTQFVTGSAQTEELSAQQLLGIYMHKVLVCI